MVNELQDLMRQNVAAPPPDDLDLTALVGAGRRRVRRRRIGGAVGGAALSVAAVATVIALTTGGAPSTTDDIDPAGPPPRPDAPTLTLSDAVPAVAGEDYTELASYTNDNLNRDNGQYLDGVTEDGLILFRDGPRSGQLYPRFALMEPATGEKDWLPRLRIGQTQTWPVSLTADRLVLLASDLSRNGDGAMLAYVFDRDDREWTEMRWPGLPQVDFPRGSVGPDGRLYTLVPNTQGQPPEGGWPTGPDGEADDANAEGDTYRLWSLSLSDPSDARDEDLTLGELAFTDSAMVWTDATNGAAGKVHVRDLASGEETSFDPESGEKCNLLSFGATDERVVMSQYCGTYAQGVRDDRVQILTTDGEQVATVQASDVSGWLPAGSDVVNVAVYRRNQSGGTFAYDLATDKLWRISDELSSYGLGGPVGGDRQLMWHTPVNGGKGATQHVGSLSD
ncbi:MAG: hypothetical protein WBP61_19305 [Nocardioides sp.]